LPDVQESLDESENPIKLKPSRFSFSRLIRGSNNSPCSDAADAKKVIEMTSIKTTQHPSSRPCGSQTHTPCVNPVIPGFIHEEESLHSSDVSSDEDDHGITFTAKTPEKDIFKPAPKLGPASKVEALSEANIPKLSSTPISERRHSAFLEVKPILTHGQGDMPEPPTNSTKDAFKETEEEHLSDCDAELQALKDKDR